MPISSAVCIAHPGSVNSGGTWQVEQRAGPLNSCLPVLRGADVEAAAGAAGAGIASW